MLLTWESSLLSHQYPSQVWGPLRHHSLCLASCPPVSFPFKRVHDQSPRALPAVIYCQRNPTTSSFSVTSKAPPSPVPNYPPSLGSSPSPSSVKPCLQSRLWDLSRHALFSTSQSMAYHSFGLESHSYPLCQLDFYPSCKTHDKCGLFHEAHLDSTTRK